MPKVVRDYRADSERLVKCSTKIRNPGGRHGILRDSRRQLPGPKRLHSGESCGIDVQDMEGWPFRDAVEFARATASTDLPADAEKPVMISPFRQVLLVIAGDWRRVNNCWAATACERER